MSPGQAAEDALRLWREARHRLVERRATRASVHHWRLCTRRLLALEALLAPRAPRSDKEGFAALLDHAFHAAGHMRDTQVAIQELEYLERRFPEAHRLARHLKDGMARQRDKAIRRVRATSYRHLQDEVARWKLPSSADASRLVSARASRRLASAEGRLAAMVRSDPAPRQLHSLRIQLKRIRYMIELCESLRVGAHPKWPISKIVQLQDALGEVTDITVLQESVAEFASKHNHWRTKSKGLARYLDRRRAALRRRALQLAAAVT